MGGGNWRSKRCFLSTVWLVMSVASSPETALLSPRARLLLFLAIVLGIMIRTVAFDGPVLDHHFMRQSDTAAIARNFANEGMDFFHPRIDWRGDTPGYVESEFPIYTYSVAVLYRLFGEHEELARGLNILLFAFTSLVLFDFVRRMFGSTTALLSVFFMSVMPLSAYFTRTFQPDTLMVLASLSSIYFFWRWSNEKRIEFLAISAVAVSVAILIKPMNVYLGAPILYLCFTRLGWGFLRKIELWAFGAVALLPAFAWYSYAYGIWIHDGNTFFRPYSAVSFSWLIGEGDGSPAFEIRRRSLISDMLWRIGYLV
ncbi:MAG: glycosyltransferase family 39 protein, partial [Caulobacterales bacterium]